MRSKTRRWNAGELELFNALEIIELLAVHPSGLTIPEIVACLRKPPGEVVRNIALLQRRRWLHPSVNNAWLVHARIPDEPFGRSTRPPPRK